MANFGYSTIGGTSWGGTQSHLIEASAPISGTVSSMMVYVVGGASSTPFVLGLYDATGSGGDPGARLSVSTTQTIAISQTAGWVTVTVPSASVTSGTNYWLAICANGGGGTFRYDATGATTGRGNASFPDLTNPYGAPGWHDSATFSLQAVVTAPASTAVVGMVKI